MTGWQAAVLAVYLGSKLDKQNRRAEAEERAREKAETEALIREIDPKYAAYREAEQQKWEEIYKANREAEAKKPPLTHKQKIRAALFSISMLGSLVATVAFLAKGQFLLGLLFVLVAFFSLGFKETE
ncbi:MAG: hypothetical protein FWD91_03750 [Treponema sp.]|nr:hypothetical protein [Treponema sp.]